MTDLKPLACDLCVQAEDSGSEGIVCITLLPVALTLICTLIFIATFRHQVQIIGNLDVPIHKFICLTFILHLLLSACRCCACTV